MDRFLDVLVLILTFAVALVACWSNGVPLETKVFFGALALLALWRAIMLW